MSPCVTFHSKASNEDPEDVFQPDEDMLEVGFAAVRSSACRNDSKFHPSFPEGLFGVRHQQAESCTGGRPSRRS